MHKSFTIAYFISPHGLGHASRASAVMEEIWRIMPETRFEIFTLVPEWFFRRSLPLPLFGYHHTLTDIGLVQKTPLIEDVEKTIERLDEFLPFDPDYIEELTGIINQIGCDLMICDISALGIVVAKRAGIPSVLIENFTWDWIYEGYRNHRDRLKRHIEYLRGIYSSVDYHIQTEPICNPLNIHLKTAPVSRRIRIRAQKIRESLGIPQDSMMVVLTISGNTEGYGFIRMIDGTEDIFFVALGISQKTEKRGNIILLPQDTHLSHPDLVNASDVTIGKLGYSTVAEVYHAGVPFGYLTRKTFRESERLEGFCRREMHCLSIDEERLKDGRCLEDIKELLEMPRIKHTRDNGAIKIAEFICNILKGG
jgi:hypothetical protein